MLIDGDTGGFLPIDERIEQLADQEMNILQIYEAVTSPEVYPFPDNRLDFDIAMIYSLLFTDPEDLQRLTEVFNEFFRVTNDRITGGSALPYTVQDVEALESQQQVWRDQFNRYLEEDNRRYVELVEHQQALNEQQPLLRTPLVVTRTTLQVKPKLVTSDSNGNRVTAPIEPNYGLEIFDGSRISDYIPYLQFNQPIEEQSTDIPKNKKSKKHTDGRQLTKVYRGKTQETAPKIDNIVLPLVVTQGNNMMSMSVWMGSGDVKAATKISYTHSRYMLDTNQMFIQVPSTTGGASDLIISRIESALPLELGPTEEVRISGEFTIYELAFNRAILLDLILNNPLFSAYLYVDEVAKPSADKNRDHIHYKSILSKATNYEPGALRERSSVSVKLVPGTVGAGTVRIPTDNSEEVFGISDTVVNPDGSLSEVAIPEGTPYVTVKIIRAESKEVAEQFIEIFTRILSAYTQYQGPIADYYSSILGSDFSPVILPPPQIAKGRATEQYRAEALSAAAPDIFIPGYARKCQSKLQPAIANEEEVQDIQAQTFIKGNVVYNRQILPFPKGNPRLYLWCPQENAPFPGVKANNLANSIEHPYVPCCFDSDQTSGRSKSAYNDYFQGTKKQTSITSSAKNKIKTAKTLQPGRVGYLPTVIEQLLIAFGIQPSESESYRGASRFGVIQGPNSFLHAVCIAVGNPQYNSLQTVDEREMFVQAVRLQMAQQLAPGLLKQELYDLSDSEIIGRLQDTDLFFDPALYYRAVEELFGINVYVFVPPNVRENVKEASLELPRHKLFHVRPDRPDRPTVIIYKHLGAEVDVLPYSQCELIIEMQEQPTMIFGPEVTQNLYQTLIQSNQLYTWEFVNNGDILGRKDLYIQFDFPLFLQQQGFTLLEQVVDRYGKLRGITYDRQGIQGSLLFLPSQPLNLPTTTLPTRISYQDIPPDFGEISSVSISTLASGEVVVTGVWYPGLGSANTIYVPIEPTTDLLNYEQGPSDPIFTEQTSFTLRLQKLKRDANIVIQLLTWLYVISQQSPTEFVESNILSGEDQDTAQVYDFTGLSRHLPRVSSYQEAIQYISRVTSGFIRNGKIYLTGERLLDAAKYVLRLYDSVTIDRVPPSEIKGLFVYESDFVQQARVALFLSARDLQLWIKSVLADKFRSFDIRDSLNPEYSNQEEPYLYTSPEGNIYQVQNVFERDLQSALNVAQRWQQFKMNPGSSPEITNLIDSPYIIFGIGTTNNLVPIEDQRIDDEPFLQILSYGGNKYAALLPLN